GDDADDRGVRADAEREREHRHQREAGIARHPAQAVARVLSQVLEPAPAPRVAALLAQDRRVAEPPARGRVRLVGRDAGGARVRGAQVEVEAHLLGEIAVEAPSAQKHAHPAGELSQAHRSSSYAVWSTRTIAPITRSNCDISAASCFFPAAVSL